MISMPDLTSSQKTSFGFTGSYDETFVVPDDIESIPVTVVVAGGGDVTIASGASDIHGQ